MNARVPSKKSEKEIERERRVGGGGRETDAVTLKEPECTAKVHQ